VLAAVITAALTRGRAGLKELGLRIIRWRVRWYWYVVAVGLPLVIHGLNVVINQWVGIGIPGQDFSSIAGWLLIFGVRLIHPVNGPVGEEPGWRGFALPGPKGDALATSLHGDPRRAGHHLASAPLLCRRRQPFVANRCRRRHWAVRLHICGYLAVQPHFRQRADDDHPVCGGRECPAQGWVYSGLWMILATGLVIFDGKSWRSPAPPAATTPLPDQPPKSSPRTATGEKEMLDQVRAVVSQA
jgi:uncharacterized protein